MAGQLAYKLPDTRSIGVVDISRSPNGPEAPSSRVAYLAAMLSRTLSQQIERELRPLELTQAQLGALALLALRRDGYYSAAELSRRTGVTPQSMSAATASLAERGLITRTPSSEGGREVQLRVTDVGFALLLKAQERSRVVNARALAMLNESEREQLRALMLRVLTALSVPVDDY